MEAIYLSICDDDIIEEKKRVKEINDSLIEDFEKKSLIYRLLHHAEISQIITQNWISYMNRIEAMINKKQHDWIGRNSNERK